MNAQTRAQVHRTHQCKGILPLVALFTTADDRVVTFSGLQGLSCWDFGSLILGSGSGFGAGVL